MNRRHFLGAAVFLPQLLLMGRAEAQLATFALRLVRRTGWEELMGSNQCVISDLYYSIPSFPISDLGTRIGTGLELAYRNNMSDISAIPAGEYRGGVRTEGRLGWRIELEGVDARGNIQIHVGNTPNQSRGCILIGTGDRSDRSCSVSGSKAGMHMLKSLYGGDNTRPVFLKIQA